MIERATVDAYGESEQTTGWFTMIDESLAVPFETTVLGMPVTVERVDMNATSRSSPSGSVVATGRRCRSSIFRCRRRRPRVRNGSKRTVSGAEENDHVAKMKEAHKEAKRRARTADGGDRPPGGVP